MVTSITSWVLRHKRLVIGFWIVLTIVGGAASGPASKAMDQKFSVPGKEGWEANKEIQRRFHGTGGNASPLVPGEEGGGANKSPHGPSHGPGATPSPPVRVGARKGRPAASGAAPAALEGT